MSFFEETESLFYLARFRDQARHFNELVIEKITASLSTESCSGEVELEKCRDDDAALRLKLIAMATILFAGVVGVATPLVGRKRRFLRTDGGVFVFAKAFAAGVILATGFVHMLHDAQEALTDPCVPETPWRRFPFPGFIAMTAALATLVADYLCTQFYKRKHREEAMGVKAAAAAAIAAAAAEEDQRGITVVVAAEPEVDGGYSGSNDEHMHIGGMSAHAGGHRHSHDHHHGPTPAAHAHAHAHEDYDSEVSTHVRHVVVSQILELGIVSHSVIIGLSLGVSRSPCTIRPLVAALSFHQFFEGFALGGCISQAQFRNVAAATMACFFAITTPTGIAVGAGIASFYNASSPRALVVEGILDSISAGILIYMALVDLIAADFLSHKMSCSVRTQAASYVALFLGAACMSALALWA